MGGTPARGCKVRRFALFLLSGGAAAAANWGSRFLFSLWMPFEAAVVAAFMVGLVTGFVLMRVFVFEGVARPVLPQAGRYAIVNAAALMQTFVVSVVMARWALPAVGVREHAEPLGHLAGVLFPVVTSYFAHRMYTFR
ncbi:MAG TPA: GtrA family protein [Burkholderiales bacterium]